MWKVQPVESGREREQARVRREQERKENKTGKKVTKSTDPVGRGARVDWQKKDFNKQKLESAKKLRRRQ